MSQSNPPLEQIEAEIWKGDAKCRLLVENLPSVVWSTSQEGKTVFISHNVEAVYGYTPQEIYDEGAEVWLDRLHPDDLPNVLGASHCPKHRASRRRPVRDPDLRLARHRARRRVQAAGCFAGILNRVGFPLTFLPWHHSAANVGRLERSNSNRPMSVSTTFQTTK